MRDPVHDRFEQLKTDSDDADWREVRRRAYGRRRAVTALVAASAVFIALLVAPGIGLGGRIIGLFSAPGKPVGPGSPRSDQQHQHSNRDGDADGHCDGNCNRHGHRD